MGKGWLKVIKIDLNSLLVVYSSENEKETSFIVKLKLDFPLVFKEEFGKY